MGTVDPIEEITRRYRLRWLGHVERKKPDELTSRLIHCKPTGISLKRGRPPLTLEELQRTDLIARGINNPEHYWFYAIDRKKWKTIVRTSTGLEDKNESDDTDE